MPQLTGLHVYPVKSTYRLSPESARVEPWGLAGDRRWMLVDRTGRAVTQREEPTLGQFRAVPAPDGSLTVTAPDGGRIEVPVPVDGKPVQGEVFGSFFATVAAGEAVDSWFCRYFPGVRLVHLADPLARPVKPEYAGPGDTVSAADGFPLLVTTTGSLAALNARIAEDHPEDERKARPVPMERFRPNLVVDVAEPWDEDGWLRVRVGEVTFRVARPCGRCVVTTTDQETGERRGPEPLRALGRHHRLEQKLVFGQNLVPERPEGFTGTVGTVRLGDGFTVLERR
ncbi:MOSC domain-containing protein [Kitasatospora sp. NPDC096147]|uniref:MOSC domain-containing protein n=1 Tax=Kitasatospora sp. NPDC096147 TaxID=3364093 RepID=UPI00380320E4